VNTDAEKNRRPRIRLLLARALQRLVWADVDTRQELQRQGVNIVPVNFYSNTPTLDEIADSFEYASAQAPYLHPEIFDEDRLLAQLDILQTYAAEFDAPSTEVGQPDTSFYWENGQFEGCDATTYYCMLRYYKPKTVIEIGSGFSTLVAIKAVERNGFGRVVCIEPHPRDFLAKIDAIELIECGLKTFKPISFMTDWKTAMFCLSILLTP
jgi:hypothetical protein